MRVCPTALAKLLVRPEISQDFEARPLPCPPFFAPRRQDDADNIITIRRARQTEHSPIDTRCPRYLSLLSQVNILFGRGEPVRSARLHFHKAEHRTIVGNQVDLCVNERAAQVSADGKRKVGSRERVAKLFQTLSREPFAALSEQQMRSDFSRRAFLQIVC